MIENKLLSSVQQITINNGIYAVNRGGEICYNEKVTKDTLLPLKLQIKQFFENGNNFKISYNRFTSYTTTDNALFNFVQGKLWTKKNISV